MAKYYIAFSINGTDCFITATYESNAPEAAQMVSFGSRFKEAQSRRPGFDRSKGIKLHWDGLLTKEGKPLRSPQLVISRMKSLEKLGWTVDKGNFAVKHLGTKDGRKFGALQGRLN